MEIIINPTWSDSLKKLLAPRDRADKAWKIKNGNM